MNGTTKTMKRQFKPFNQKQRETARHAELVLSVLTKAPTRLYKLVNRVQKQTGVKLTGQQALDAAIVLVSYSDYGVTSIEDAGHAALSLK